MKHYVLVKEGAIIQHYHSGTKPTIAASKGTVYEYVTATAPTATEAQKVVESWGVVGEQYLQVFTLIEKTPYELAMQDWAYPEFQKRIVAPKSLLFDQSGIAVLMKTWFDIEGLPIESKGTNVRMYCREILADHQAVVDSLQAVITIETRPINE